RNPPSSRYYQLRRQGDRMSRSIAFLVVLLVCVSMAVAQTPPPFVGLGDSLGEGVQSADANTATQPNDYLHRFAAQAGLAFPLPLIKTRPLAVIGSTANGSRVDPNALVANLSVSGADSTSILNEVAGTPIVTETDLVESPRTGSQIQIAQQLKAPFMICW